ncbi:MAG: protein phosphatase 2C domain-containing protein [Merismopedia sp. SIO2A8]|nr:protein phosphatase 2C domain-containing protein [Symploca sp. SIO2B6]NET52986.1 protein phosphatase 2C domain-containing protein [Merismopedia sp. SIO2A8]
MGWKTITRSVRGTRHCQQNLSCQDYGLTQVQQGWVMGVVADGAGSAAHSDQGAAIAVQTMLNHLASRDWAILNQDNSDDSTQGILYKRFVSGLKTVQNALQIQAQQGGYPINSLACTLLGFVATPTGLAAFQVGDGFIVVQLATDPDSQAPSSPYQLLFPPDKGEYANQTTFVTSEEAIATLQSHVLLQAPTFICASTDGLDPVAIRRPDLIPFAPFFQPLNDYLAETTNPEQDDTYIMTFLQSERLNQRTDDDKTLLLCRYSHSAKI